MCSRKRRTDSQSAQKKKSQKVYLYVRKRKYVNVDQCIYLVVHNKMELKKFLYFSCGLEKLGLTSKLLTMRNQMINF